MDILTEKIAKEFAELKRLLFRATYNRLEPTISSSQGELLFLVASHQSQTMKELATKLGVSSGAITQLVDGLAVHHLLERKHDEHDRRIVRISLSTYGSKQLSKLKKEHFQSFKECLSVLDEKDLNKLHEILQKLTVNK
jgi:DNA-binding MarR family transcriptional regulator